MLSFCHLLCDLAVQICVHAEKHFLGEVFHLRLEVVSNCAEFFSCCYSAVLCCRVSIFSNA